MYQMPVADSISVAMLSRMHKFLQQRLNENRSSKLQGKNRQKKKSNFFSCFNEVMNILVYFYSLYTPLYSFLKVSTA